MSGCKSDLCLSCSKKVRIHQKDISCKVCHLFIHKKCTKLKRKDIIRLNVNECTCMKCISANTSGEKNQNDDTVHDFNASEGKTSTCSESINANFSKYDKMIFTPFKYQNDIIDNDAANAVNSKCMYVTPEELRANLTSESNIFSILNVNIRSLNKNFERLKQHMKTTNHEYTIIGLSETHLKDKPTEYYNLSGYSLEYTNRTRCEEGGVCMYISQNVKYKLRNDLCKAAPNYESCFIEIDQEEGKNIIVGVLYRAHTSIDNFITDISPTFETISNENKTCYVMGDFNIDLLKEEVYRPIRDYLNLLFSHSFLPKIVKPTRITPNTATLIDNIFTNNHDDVNSFITITDISDHFPTVISTKLNFRKNQSVNSEPIYKRSFSDGNINNLKQKLSLVKWNELLDGEDADEDYNKFIEVFMSLYDECIPLRKIKPNKRKDPIYPWITKGLLNSIKTKNKLYKECKKRPTERRITKFKVFRNKLHNLIRISKRKFYENKFQKSKNDMKKTWKTINNILGRKKNALIQAQFKNSHGETISDPQLIANDFNDFFVNIGPNLTSKINSTGKEYYEYLKDPIQKSVFLSPVIDDEIVKIITKFDQTKSPGHDNIGNNIIKRIAKEISKPLAIIFNLSITTGKFPNQLKSAKVIPIYKKDDAEIYSNYRPVSVLPSFF